jgi:hypothetical protein
VSRRSPANECTISELIFLCFGLLVGKGSVEVGITVVRKIVLQKRLLAHEFSIGAKTQFAILYRPLRITYSQPLSLHDRGDHLCRDGGAKGRYFESADRGAELTRSPIFGASSSARLAVLRFELARSTSCMTRRASQLWQASADTYAYGCTHVT